MINEYIFLLASTRVFSTLALHGFKFCQTTYANFQRTIRFLSKFCIPPQFHERLLLCTFLAQTIYSLLLRRPLKWKSLRLLISTQVKICQIPYANFETTSWFLPKFCIIQFLFKFCIILHFNAWILSSYFSYFGLKNPIIIPILRL